MTTPTTITPPTVTYGSPIQITTGGTYTGAWESDDDTPPITINTDEEVIIEYSSVRGPGPALIQSVAGIAVNVTIRRTYGTSTGTEECRFGKFDVGFNKVVIEHCEMDGTSGCWFHNSQPSLISLKYNRIRNITGGDSYIQAFQFDKVFGGTLEIAWNEIVNYPGESRTEDVISFYASGADGDGWTVHDNLIWGAYPNPITDPHSGGGIMHGDNASGSPWTDVAGYIETYNNVILGTTNYGISIVAGTGNYVHDNIVISSGVTAEGDEIDAVNVGLSFWKPGWETDYTNNQMINNEVGWWKADESTRNDWYAPQAGIDGNVFSGNTHYDAEGTEIPYADEQSAYDDWWSRTGVASVFIGFDTSSGDPDGPGNEPTPEPEPEPEPEPDPDSEPSDLTGNSLVENVTRTTQTLYPIERVVHNLLPNTRYLVRVRSYNNFNIYSEWSDALEFTTPQDTSVPKPPTKLEGNFSTADLYVQWEAPTANVDETILSDLAYYEVTFETPSAQKLTVRAYSEAYTLSYNAQLNAFGTPRQIVSVSVKAVDSSGNASTAISSQFSNSPPPTPTNAATNQVLGGIYIRVEIGDVGDFKGIQIQRSDNGGTSWAQIYDGRDTSYMDMFPPGDAGTYQYRVRTYDLFGQLSGWRQIAASSPGTPAEIQDIFLDDMMDVEISAPSDDQILQYDSATGLWKNVAMSVVDSDKTYVHNQGVASTTWNVNHNLNKYPTVATIDSADTVVMGKIVYVDADNITITFNSAFSGKAFCN